MLSKLIFSLFLSVSAIAVEDLNALNNLSRFVETRKAFVAQLDALKTDSRLINRNDLIGRIRDLRQAYSKLDRKSLTVEDLYDAQFQLRFVNRTLKTLLLNLSRAGALKNEDRQEIEFEAQILGSSNQTRYVSPQKSLPIEGIKSSEWPLKRWESDPEFYRYQFDGNDILFRGLRLRAGDMFLNHPKAKPVGIFTAISEERSLFSHGSMIAVLHNQWGRLPVVIDIHERGVRAVPLHHYMDSQVVGYGEIFRLRETTSDFEIRVNQAIRELMSEEHPYDLTGSEDRKALSCVEMISYVLELMGEPKLAMQTQIRTPIYQNILRLGKFAQQKFQTPNDVFQDPRVDFVGYVDNAPALEIQLINEFMLDWFREKLETKVIKSEKNLMRIFGEAAIDQIRNEHSLFGGFLLGATGFNRENFPAGDRGLLAAVNAIDNIFVRAMSRCLKGSKIRKENFCLEAIKRAIPTGLAHYDYSIRQWKTDQNLRDTSNGELKEFDNMFE